MTRVPAVSVLLPVRNGGAALADCLTSLSAQSLTDYELVAVDDGSDDATPVVLREAAGNDARIRLLSPGRIGLVAALNLGLESARAPLVARMDADDRMHRRRLELQVRYLGLNPRVTAVGSRVRPFPGHALSPGMAEYLRWQDTCLEPEQITREIYWEAPLVHPSVTFRAASVRGLGGYRDGDFPEDYELWLRLVEGGAGIAKLPERLLHWRLRTDSTWRRDPRYAREAFDRVRAEYLARDPRLATDRPLVVWGAGRRTRRRVERALAGRPRPAAYVDVDPRKLGNRIGGVPVVPPGWLRRDARPFVLACVTSRGARQQIGGRLDALGYRAGTDYLMVG